MIKPVPCIVRTPWVPYIVFVSTNIACNVRKYEREKIFVNTKINIRIYAILGMTALEHHTRGSLSVKLGTHVRKRLSKFNPRRVVTRGWNCTLLKFWLLKMYPFLRDFCQEFQKSTPFSRLLLKKASLAFRNFFPCHTLNEYNSSNQLPVKKYDFAVAHANQLLDQVKPLPLCILVNNKEEFTIQPWQRDVLLKFVNSV
jgi:hypothetical protein